MKYNLDTLNAAHHATELVEALSRLPSRDLEALATLIDELKVHPRVLHGLRILLAEGDHRRPSRRREESFEEFRFDYIMHRLRNAVMHASSAEDAAELDWLLKIILASPVVFDSVRELDNFLSNMTGAEHTTKSTGRDRVVDWYFKLINSFDDDLRNHTYLKIARYIFATSKSNYREWKEVLYGGNSR